MTALNYLSNNRLSNKVLLRVITVFALIGFADTMYLTANHYFGEGVKCVLLEGCDIVLTSQYSQILGVPLALIGAVFYAGIFILASMADIYQNNLSPKLPPSLMGPGILRWLALAGVLGFMASLFLLYLQIFVIRALCIYCLTSLGTSTIIFISSVVLYKKSLNEIS